MKKLQSNKEWEKWGVQDPLYAVASWKEKDKSGLNPWTNEDFFALGEKDWRDFEDRWIKYGLNKKDCLEIGCGAGRITKQLVGYFDKVYAIDVSKDMIEYAKINICSNQKPVEFILSEGIDIPLDDKSISSVFSCHVFQHLDNLTIAESYFREISRILKDDGTFMIHLPIYVWPSGSKSFEFLYLLRQFIGGIKARIYRSLMELNMISPIMRGLWFPIEFFYTALPLIGFKDINIQVFLTKSDNRMHSFVFARKNG